jgi:hypothetical protein
MTPETRSYLLGALDVLFAFSLALEKRGLLWRAEIVEMLDQVEAQQVQQEGGSTARGAVVHLLRQAFAMPVAGEQVRAGFRLVDGGRPD